MAIGALLDRLTLAVNEGAALRRIRRLQPVGGAGDKIFPPTYPAERKGDPPRHVFENRRIDGQNVLCVLVDSVQSQANRLEEALKEARRDGLLSFPVISVNFEGTEVEDMGEITTLDAPHRIFDAIVRDSLLGDLPFQGTEPGRALIQAKPSAAKAVYELSPTALVFGSWNSTGEGGGLGAKFPRTVVSEIIGVGVATEGSGENERPSGQRTGSRIDPLGIRSGVQVFKYEGEWSLEPPADTRRAKALKPSEINHSNIAPTVQPLGVSVDYLRHTFVISLAGLRRFRFDDSPEKNGAARTVLATLGLAAALGQDRLGYSLRSRCELVPEAGSPQGWELVNADGSSGAFELSGMRQAKELFDAAVAQAEKLGVSWKGKDLELRPQPKLVELVVRSREKALEGLESENEDA